MTNPIWIKKSGTKVIGQTFRGPYDAALYIDQPLEDITIEHCDFSFMDYAILVNAAVKNLVFRHCTAYMLSGDGVCINTTQGNSEGLWIHDNFIHAPYSDHFEAGFGIAMRQTINSYVIQNTIRDAKWNGLHFENNCNNIWVFNNKIIGMTGHRVDDVSSWPTISGIWARDCSQLWIVGNETYDSIDCGLKLSDKNRSILITGNIFEKSRYGVMVYNTIENPNIFIGPCGEYEPNYYAGCKLEDISIQGNPKGITCKDTLPE